MISTDHTARLASSIAAVAPIISVVVGIPGDPSSIRIEFDPAATPEQRSAAAAVVQSFAWTDEAQAAWERVERRSAAKTAARAGDPASVRLRAALKVVLHAIGQDRQYMAALRSELVALGRTPPAVPPVRSWEQLLAAFDAAIDAGDGD